MITVEGYSYRPQGLPFVGDLVFQPISTPTVVGSILVMTEPFYVPTNDAGFFSTLLQPGIYHVSCVLSRVARNPVKYVAIDVPAYVLDSEGEPNYNAFVDLVTLIQDPNAGEIIGEIPIVLAYYGKSIDPLLTASTDLSIRLGKNGTVSVPAGPGYFYFKIPVSAEPVKRFALTTFDLILAGIDEGYAESANGLYFRTATGFRIYRSINQLNGSLVVQIS